MDIFDQNIFNTKVWRIQVFEITTLRTIFKFSLWANTRLTKRWFTSFSFDAKKVKNGQ